mmetsp:Transcript_111500/g.280481  ORF Transcript_111500/g.280481 Transcript_111500/m.280481 type:complete len:220 (+) Transcript_111500:655-1314(+)
MNQRATRQCSVLLEVQELPNPWLLDKNTAAALQCAQTQGHLLSIDDSEQAVVHAVLNYYLGVANGIHLPEDPTQVVALVIDQGVVQNTVLMLTLSNSRVRNGLELLPECVAIQAWWRHQQRENVRNNPHSPPLGQLAAWALVAVGIKGEQRIRRFALVPHTEGALWLVLRYLRHPWSTPLGRVLRWLGSLSASGVQRPPACGHALPQHAELVRCVGLAL